MGQVTFCLFEQFVQAALRVFEDGAEGDAFPAESRGGERYGKALPRSSFGGEIGQPGVHCVATREPELFEGRGAEPMADPASGRSATGHGAAIRGRHAGSTPEAPNSTVVAKPLANLVR